MINFRQRGFTLIELIMFIVIVGVGVAGVLSVFTTGVKNSADPMVRKQALSIAESLLEEILLKDFVDPNGGTNGVSTCTLAAGTNRSLWDDVCDYNTHTSTGIRDVQGNSVASLASYSVLPAVAVTTVTVGGVNLKRVEVSVTDTQNNVISIVGYRGNDR
ncbi:MAG: prepilin-type N-terminal cleavage/methylation domain-containing protein [Rhodoferax sp.]|nr:prepilin-type N-terminal cleavage/methylation domain-containing protein [Rhodoferax sp.]